MEDQSFAESLEEMLKIARASVSGFLLTPRERDYSEHPIMNRLLPWVNLNRVILVLFKLLRNPLDHAAPAASVLMFNHPTSRACNWAICAWSSAAVSNRCP
jgi:hypothetical protein